MDCLSFTVLILASSLLRSPKEFERDEDVEMEYIWELEAQILPVVVAARVTKTKQFFSSHCARRAIVQYKNKFSSARHDFALLLNPIQCTGHRKETWISFFISSLLLQTRSISPSTIVVASSSHNDHSRWSQQPIPSEIRGWKRWKSGQFTDAYWGRDQRSIRSLIRHKRQIPRCPFHCAEFC